MSFAISFPGANELHDIKAAAMEMFHMKMMEPYCTVNFIQNIKQTQVKPKVNRGCPIGLVSHIQPQLSRLCGKYSWTPTSPNGNGATHFGDFNALHNKHPSVIFCSYWDGRTIFYTNHCLGACLHLRKWSGSSGLWQGKDHLFRFGDYHYKYRFV